MGIVMFREITNEDVKEFRRLLHEDGEKLTPKKARRSLIQSGVLDSNGKPRWPTEETNGRKQKKTAHRGK